MLAKEREAPAKQMHYNSLEFQKIADDFLKWVKIKSKPEPEAENNLTVKTIALMHVYLAMFKGKPVTQQNKDELAEKYKFKNGTQLRNEFTKFQNEDKRMDLNSTSKKAANDHLQRFRDILPLLENENIQAYSQAKEDLETLEKEYEKYH